MPSHPLVAIIGIAEKRQPVAVCGCRVGLLLLNERGRIHEQLPSILLLEAGGRPTELIYRGVLAVQNRSAERQLRPTILIDRRIPREVLQGLANEEQRGLRTRSSSRASANLLREIADHPCRPIFGRVAKATYRRVYDQEVEQLASDLSFFQRDRDES